VKKKRIAPGHTRNFGNVEVLCFLHAWTTMDPEPGKTHGLSNPPQERVAAVFAERGEELREVFDRVCR